MPLPSPPRPSSGPSSWPSSPPPPTPARWLRRRSLLVGALGTTAAATALTGCSDAGPAAGRAEQAERSSAAQKLRDRSARESRELLARYDATAEAHPALADRLVPLRAETAEHADALGAPRPRSSASSSASESSASGASPSPSESAPHHRPAAAPPQVPDDEGEALAALADAERRTADARATALLKAPPELARLLASIAAAGAAHAYLLTEGG